MNQASTGTTRTLAGRQRTTRTLTLNSSFDMPDKDDLHHLLCAVTDDVTNAVAHFTIDTI